MSLVRVIHEFDLRDEDGGHATRDQVECVISNMTVQVDEEPVIGYLDGWYERIGEVHGTVKVDVIHLSDTDNPIDVGIDAFWMSVSRAYPYIKTGDVDPLVRERFRDEAVLAVAQWLEMNR